MISALSILILLGAFFFWLRKFHPRETRLILSATLDQPASSIFEVIGDVMRAPSWSRQPTWLPRAVRMSRMSPLGAHIPARQLPQASSMAPEEIRIRCLQNREYSYRSTRPHDFSYESAFYLTPDQGKCLLIWEIRFRTNRVPDIVGRALIATRMRASMVSSLAHIRRLAATYGSPAYARNEIYEARAGQIPAA
jgi:hypothetical protein